MPQGGDENGIRVLRVDDDAADALRLPQAHEHPRLAAVERLIDAVSPGRTLAAVGLARPRPDDIGVRRCDGQIADRKRDSLFIEDRLPGQAVVDALKNAPRRRGDKNDLCVVDQSLDVIDPAAEAGRPDLPPPDVPEKVGQRIGRAGPGGGGQQEQAQEQDGEHDRATGFRHRVSPLHG